MRLFVALVLLCTLLLVPFSAQAGDDVCIISAAGIKICGVPAGPLPTITVKPPTVTVPGPTKTLKLPQDTKTVTVHPPSQTRTVTPPPRTIQPAPETITVTPDSITVTPDAVPDENETVTSEVTETVSPTGQASEADGKIVPGNEVPNIDFGDDHTTAAEVGIGLLTLLVLMGLLLLMLYLGYILGYKDKERKDTDFMRALLDAAALRRGKHS